MTRQWDRQCRLSIGSGGQALDLSAFRIRFEVSYATVQHPTYADITIDNLSDQTSNQVNKEFNDVTLEAGYAGNMQLIFKGQATYKRAGRETLTETYLNLLCKSGDKAYNFATVSKTLAAGHTLNDQIQVAVDAMKQHGIEIGQIAQLDQRKAPRAITLFGMAREVLRRTCSAANASWTIHNNKLQVIKNSEGLPGGTIVLNSRTGMIGRPVQTFEGIEVRCLLNPQVAPGTKVQIDEKSIERVKLDPDWSDRQVNAYLPPLATDGVYTAMAVRHTGDTRGQPWYTDIVCINAPGFGGLPQGTNLAAISSIPIVGTR